MTRDANILKSSCLGGQLRASRHEPPWPRTRPTILTTV